LKRRKLVILGIILALIYAALASYTGLMTPLAVVSSDSMQPILYKGDIILVKRYEASQLVVGDIIVFNAPKPYDDQNPVVHRIVRIWEANGQLMYHTKGDHNLLSDPYDISAVAILGLYDGARLSYIGNLLLFLRTPLGVVSAIGAVMALTAVEYLRGRRPDSRSG